MIFRKKYVFEVFGGEFREFWSRIQDSEIRSRIFWLSKSTFQCHSFLPNCLSLHNFEKPTRKFQFFVKNEKITIFLSFWFFRLLTGGALWSRTNLEFESSIQINFFYLSRLNFFQFFPTQKFFSIRNFFSRFIVLTSINKHNKVDSLAVSRAFSHG